jgi:two-component system, NtrC family, nitrogen regulation response regulator NtrX
MAIRSSLRDILEYEEYEVDEAVDGEDGLKKLSQRDYDLVLCDIKMPRVDGMEVLQKAKQQEIAAAFIMISAHGTIDVAVEATKKGAFDFIQKPPDLNRLLLSVKNALENSTLSKETKVLKEKINKHLEIVGESTAIKEVKILIEKVAHTDARVLITGPNGAGKELVARQLHELSSRSKAPFVEVNCAAIPSELIESELFGHEKGSFTSALKQRIGKFEQAEGGTIFLDEIGDMSLAAQAKVLRVLQENKLSRVGGDKDITVDVRIIAATNKDLKKEYETGLFREDLYHRLSVIPIHVPPLSERLDDIPLLAQRFLETIAKEQGSKPKIISKEALQYLSTLPWTGNIRELRNVIERLVILGGDNISVQDAQKYT